MSSLLHSIENLKPENIGKVVSIQVFKREAKDSDSLIHSSLMKYVGILQGYTIDNTGYGIFLTGFRDIIFINARTQYVEIFAHYQYQQKE